MRTKTQASIQAYFNSVPEAVFRFRDILGLLQQHYQDWNTANANEVINYLIDQRIIKRAELKSADYEPKICYIRGNPSNYVLAVALRDRSFLSHATSLAIHGLAEPTNAKIYVNQEQAPKPKPEDIAQEDITMAFKRKQRRSKYIFRYKGTSYILLNGKNTGRAGVKQLKTPSGDSLDCTDLKRTLIDIVVRPAYSGGLSAVCTAYKQAVHRIDAEYMFALLKKMEYAYPYHQSIGFLLRRAGLTEDRNPFAKKRAEFDFFLDYGICKPAYDKKWRLYYPTSLK